MPAAEPEQKVEEVIDANGVKVSMVRPSVKTAESTPPDSGLAVEPEPPALKGAVGSAVSSVAECELQYKCQLCFGVFYRECRDNGEFPLKNGDFGLKNMADHFIIRGTR